MPKRKTIGENPLDAVVPDPAVRAKTTPRPSQPETERSDDRRQPKERLTVHLPVGLIDRMRNAVYWTPGLTLAGLAEDAIDDILAPTESTISKQIYYRR